jgi:adenosine deaminase
MRDLIAAMPKVELHLHIEGTLEPELMFELAARKGLALPWTSVEELRAAYEFEDLQSFLDLYYQGAAVLVDEEDFFELTWAYLRRAAENHVRHVEIFFDPQTHTARGVELAVAARGIHAALERGRSELGISSGLIACFLRDLDEAQAHATLDELLRSQVPVIGVGLDSAERDNPPEKFARVFARARAEGLHLVAHAGEEGPPAYIEQALDLLKVERIDHGVRCVESEALVRRLVDEAVPLTVCPLSNVKLRVFERLADHNLAGLLRAGVRVTINSDDPAYFGGYIGANFQACAEVLELSPAELAQLGDNAVAASFVDEPRRAELRAELRDYFGSVRM